MMAAAAALLFVLVSLATLNDVGRDACRPGGGRGRVGRPSVLLFSRHGSNYPPHKNTLCHAVAM